MNSDQFEDVLDQIEGVLPSADSMANSVRNALGLSDDEFDIRLEDADDDPATPGTLAIVKLRKDIVESVDDISLDFSLGEDVPVSIDTGGEIDLAFEGALQFEFGVNLSDGVDLADRVFIVGRSDPNATPADNSDDLGTFVDLGASVEADGLSIGLTIGGIGGANVVTDGHVEVKSQVNSAVTQNTPTTFTVDTAIPAGVDDLVFISVDGEIQHSVDDYSLSGQNITFNTAPGGTVMAHFPADPSNAVAIVGLNVEDAVNDGDAHNIIPFTDLFSGGATVTPVADGVLAGNLPVTLPFVDPV